jgi:iron complex outermembrane recepter protein
MKTVSFRGLTGAAAALVLAGLALASTAPAAAAQSVRGTVEGTVTDARLDTPIAGATVGTGLPGQAVATDSAGRYRLTGIDMGAQRIEIRAVGYRPVWRTVTVVIGEVARADVRLEPAAVTLPEVVVSTSREQQSAALAPLSIGVIDEQEIEEARAHHPAEIVNRTPGVYVSNFGGEGHATSIRQPITTKAVYAFLEDGVPVRSTGFFNHNALYEINIPHAARLEIIKGPGSAIYGSDAIGGVINSFTRDPSPELTGELFLEGGSATYLRALASASGTAGRHGFRGDVNLTQSDGWRNGASYERQGGTLRWDVALGEGSRLKTVASASRIHQPGDGGSDLSLDDYENRPELVYTPIAFRKVGAARLSSELQVQRGLSSFGATAYVRHNELDLLPSWQLSFDPQVWESRNQSVGLLTRYRQTVLPLRTNLSAGVDLDYSPGSRRETQIIREQDGNVYTSYTLGDLQYDYDVTFWQVSPYVQADMWVLDNVQLSAGVRYDQLGYDYDNRLTPLQTGTHRRPASASVEFGRATPKLGASWQAAPGVTVFGSYREAFRAPSESQLFRQGRAENTVDLEPVKAQSIEGGIRAAIGGIATAEATVYSMRLRDDVLTYIAPDGLRLTQNAGETSHRGIELGLGIAPVAGVRLDVSAAFMQHRYDEWQPSRVPGSEVDYSGNDMELAPRFVGNTRLTYRPAAVQGGVFSVEWTRLGSYYMDAANTVEYDGHDLFNAQANVPVAGGFELIGRVTNLANTRFAETSSYVNAQQGPRYRPGAPRQLFLGAQYQFGR